jgi:DNA sulfur modification protein DndD
MIIQKLHLKNFMCYYGENEIEFKPGINVLIGDNGYGKSKLFDAFYWVMYDQCYDTSIKKFRSTSELGESIISDKAKHETIEGKVETVVSIQLFDEKHDETYTLERVLNGNVRGSKFLVASGSVERATKKSAFNVTQVVDDQIEIDRIKKKVLPDNIKPYMWFQGEEIENIIDFRESASLTQAINILSDISRFDVVHEFSVGLSNLLQKELKKKKGSLSKNKTESTALERKINELTGQREGLKDQLDKAESNYERAQSRIDELVNSMREAEKIKDLSNEIEGLKKEYNRIHEQLKTNQVGFHKMMFQDHWITKGTAKLFEGFSEVYSKYEEDRLDRISDLKAKKKAESAIEQMLQSRLPINVPEPIYVKKMLENERCLVCDRPAKKGTSEYESIRRLIADEMPKTKFDEKISEHDFSQTLKSLYHSTLSIKDKSSDIDERINNYLENTQKLSDKEDELRGEIESKEKDLNNLILDTSIDIKTAKDLVNELQAQRNYSDRFNGEVNSLTIRIGQLDSDIDKLEKDFNKLVVGDVPKELHLKSQIGTDLEKITKSTRDRVYKSLVKQLENEANEHYMSMTKDNKSARGIIKFKEVKGNYTPILVDNYNEKLVQLNTGNIILIKLATIMAIISARKSTNETDLYTLISDAPTSVFGEDYTLGFCSTISQVYNQSIIMSKEFYKNQNLREQLLQSSDIKLGKVYMITPNLEEADRTNRKQLSTNIKSLN